MHWNVIDYNKFLNIVFMHLNKQNFIISLEKANKKEEMSS